jgi:group I intron endonuclease
MYGYIYITTNLIDGKRYIGQRKFGKREPYFGSGKYLKNALKKYGIENFKKEILCECETKEELDVKEKYYIQQYNATKVNNFYNISPGGDGGSSKGPTSNRFGKPHDDIARMHLRMAWKKRKNKSAWNKGKSNCYSEETLKKMSLAKIGKKPSEETKEKIRLAKAVKKRLKFNK